MGAYVHEAVGLPSAREPWHTKHSARVLLGVYHDSVDEGAPDTALYTILVARGVFYGHKA